MRTVKENRGSTLADFVSAVHAFSAEPSRRNLARYLLASRALDGLSRPSTARGRGDRSTPSATDPLRD
jgi:hypothetical protein